MRRRLVAGALGLAAVTGLAFGGAALAGGDGGRPGALDDGADLLPQAKITLAGAVTAARTAANGPVGEVDLERYDGRLVFNVDVGSADVKVDAVDGTVLGSVHDDEGESGADD